MRTQAGVGDTQFLQKAEIWIGAAVAYLALEVRSHYLNGPAFGGLVGTASGCAERCAWIRRTALGPSS
jgi:hypothetical protein